MHEEKSGELERGGQKRSAGSRNSSCGGEVSRARSLGARLVSSYAARTFFWSFRYDDTSL
jgi:hypothetical protein